MLKKTAPRKGTKTKRLTTPQRRVILASHGWIPISPYPDVYWRGTPTMQRVRVKTGEVSDNGGETYTKVTDRDFRAFVRKYAPTARRGTTRKVAQRGRCTTCRVTVTRDGDGGRCEACGKWVCEDHRKWASDESGETLDFCPKCFEALATDSQGQPTKPVPATATPTATATEATVAWGDIPTYGLQIKPGEPSVTTPDLTKLAADVAAMEAKVARLDGVREGMDALGRDFNRAMKALEDLKDYHFRNVPAPLTTIPLDPTGMTPSGVIVAGPANDAPAPVDVAALAKRHGLKRWRDGIYRSTPDGRPSCDTAPDMCVGESGQWFWFGNGHGKECRGYTDKGHSDTLAAALERYCPVVDAPYGEAERRADAEAVKPATPDERVAMAEKWGMECVGNAEWRCGPFAYSAATGEFSKHGMLLYVPKTANDIEQCFAGHLPYDREWREKAAKAEGWEPDTKNFNQTWRPSGAVVDRPNANSLYECGFVNAIGQKNIPLPDRAAWLAFLREHAVKRDPDATPDERRQECEARGLKRVKERSFYSRSGSIGDFPRAWLDGVVSKNVGCPTPTRTFAEFCAALDAVGLVKQEYTEATRRAACEKRGWKVLPSGVGYVPPGSECGWPFANIAGGWGRADFNADAEHLASQAEWDAWLDRHTPGQWVVPAEDVAAIAGRLDAANRRIAALEAEKVVLEGKLANVRRALGASNDNA